MGMRLWKRPDLQAFFGRERRRGFADRPAAPPPARRRAAGRLLAWAGRGDGDLPAGTPRGVALRRVEDGFLRSRGLGADLVPPLSLVADDLGIYYDPTAKAGSSG